ncbi:glycosyltransferase family 2 protein [Roseimaritima sediminicola]|uniref:glycosyltransferase family 2 protein n=1 Tax=Roseimaritima sediminicola TaxID=2662066 RepID=UPI00138757F7|nr:glycosyltransferase family 2 protein [Roseimaritima sediminicola]
MSAPNRNDGRLAIIVPVFNERSSVAACLRRVHAFAMAHGDVGEIVIVDDASTDGTVSIVEQTIADWELDAKLIRHSANRGKGAAIRTGLDHVTSPLVVVQDGDLEYDPNDLGLLLQRMRDRQGIAVYGSRRLASGPWDDRSFNAFAWGVSFLNTMVRMLYGTRITDEATCYKMFRTEDLRSMQLTCQRFEFCPEVTAKAIRMGLRIVEVPISYRPRGRDEGKKIRLRDGWQAAVTLWRLRHWVPSPGERVDSRQRTTDLEPQEARGS